MDLTPFLWFQVGLDKSLAKVEYLSYQQITDGRRIPAMWRTGLLVVALVPGIVRANFISYEGSQFPETEGFTREVQYDPVRWTADGWFYQEIDVGGGTGQPYDGDLDLYRQSLAAFPDTSFVLEWRMLTDAPDSEVDWHNGGAAIILVGGGVRYHFNMASGLTLILRGYPYPTQYFEIEPGVPHTYRLEVYDADYFEYRIDDEIMDFGVPEGLFPNPQASILFGARFYQSGHTTQWDYVRYTGIPEPTTALLLAAGALLIRRRRGQRHR
jgi:hypothetical protein